MAVDYNGTTYYYATNLQGDITAILDSTGTAVVTYTYDAWGEPLTTTGSMASTLGQLNPLRYRGYVYDQETGLYYLQSRYYNPAIGRFINADAFVSTGQGLLGNNMFAYCLNNPVNYTDITGQVATATIVLVAKVVLSGLIDAIAEAVTGGSVWTCIGALIEGAAKEALSLAIPWGNVAIIVFDVTKAIWESQENGATLSESIFVAGVSVLSNLPLDLTDDEVVNLVAEVVFGAGISLSSTALGKLLMGEFNEVAFGDYPQSSVLQGPYLVPKANSGGTVNGHVVRVAFVA